MTKPSSHTAHFDDHPRVTPAPRLGVGPHRGRRRGQVPSTCLMEYVSIVAGERFSDRPQCTHPAVAVLAWRINDELCATTRQELLHRAQALVGAGRGTSRQVRPIVLGVIADSALALDPEHRYFHRLRRRLDHAPATAGDEVEERLDTCWRHLVPMNVAITQFLGVVYRQSAHRDQREQRVIDLLDACLAAVQSHSNSAAPNSHPAAAQGPPTEHFAEQPAALEVPA